MAITFSLKFENLLNVALLDWPKDFILDPSVNQKQFIENIFDIKFIENAFEINRKQLIKYKNYDLFDLQKLISYQTFYLPEHAMMLNIHWSIFGVIVYSEFNNSSYTIRQTFSMIDDFNHKVRCSFEKGIYDLLSSRLDWREEDLELIKEYFKVNGTIVAELKDKIKDII